MAEFSASKSKIARKFMCDESFREFLLEEEDRNVCRYVSIKSRNVGNNVATKLTRVFFEYNCCKGAQIKYDGVPYVVVGYQEYHCSHGKQRTKSTKKEDQLENKNKKRKVIIQNTRKLNCEAFIQCKKIVKFPQYKLEGTDSKKKRICLAKKLKAEFDANTVQEYQILAEMNLCHTNHMVGDLAGVGLRIDKRISSKIEELVKSGNNKVDSVKPAILEYAQSLSQCKNKYNRRYFPNNVEIYSHIYRCVTANRFSHNDQECVMEMVNKRKILHPDDNIFFRPASSQDPSSAVESMLFVHQTHFQKRMLQKYGGEVVAL